MPLNRSAARQKGLSLVELLVGITVGLFVVAAAGMLVANQLTDNRRLLLETQIQQDLRSTADIIARDLKRTGRYLSAADWVWPAVVEAEPDLQVVQMPTPQEIQFRYVRASGESGWWGFKYDSATFAVQTLLPSNAVFAWQDLTDKRTLKVTAFTITDQSEPPIQLPCPKICADGTQACWPVYRVRAYKVDISGEAVSDSSVKRTVSTVVKLRNDALRYMDAANPTWICPK